MDSQSKNNILKDLKKMKVPSLNIINQLEHVSKDEWCLIYEVINETLCKLEEKLNIPFNLQFVDIMPDDIECEFPEGDNNGE